MPDKLPTWWLLNRCRCLKILTLVSVTLTAKTLMYQDSVIPTDIQVQDSFYSEVNSTAVERRTTTTQVGFSLN